MPSPLSIDLCERVVAAAAEGVSFHRAAAPFRCERIACQPVVGAVRGQVTDVAPDPTHSHDRLPAIEVQADRILSAYEARPEIFMRE